jgi:N-acetyl-gamma-glutamyl-phosphate reductase
MAIALAPLCGAELIDPQAIVVVAASGTSGAGRTPSETLLATEVMGSMSPYKVGGVHQHTPEVEQTLGAIAGRPVTLSFTPLLAPMPRGIVATCSAPIASPGVTFERVAEAFRKAYESEPFVRLLEAGRWPSTAAVLGSNAVEVQFALDEHAGRVVVVVTLDNLGKGAAGQAIQNLNLMLGLPETAGLSNLGVSP